MLKSQEKEATNMPQDEDMFKKMDNLNSLWKIIH